MIYVFLFGIYIGVVGTVLPYLIYKNYKSDKELKNV